MTHPVEPLSLERARLLLIWLQAQRTLDACLSELLAAGPAGEQRVRGQIARVTELVAATAAAFAAYRESVLRASPSYQPAMQAPPQDGSPPKERPALSAVPALPRDAEEPVRR